MVKTGNQYPPPPQYQEMGGGSGYLYLHYWPPVDREPAINVDMVNCNILMFLLFLIVLRQKFVTNSLTWFTHVAFR